MATIPTLPLLRRSDYDEKGLGTPAALDRFFAALNPFLQAASKALTGAVNIANMNGEVITFQVTTPTTDWVPIPDASKINGWVDLAAGEELAYRRDQNGIGWLRGAVKTGTTASSQIASLPSFMYPAHTHRWATYAQGNAGSETPGRMDLATNGAITLVSSSAAVAPYAFCIVDTQWPTANVGVLSCWPKTVKLQKTGQPQDVWLTSIADSDPSTAPAFAPGTMAWARVNQVASGLPNQLSVNNIPGLALGRTYNVRAWVQY